MKAIVQREYGSFDVLQLADDVPEPAPGEGEVLVRVRASSVHADVWHMMTGQPYAVRLFGGGLRRPNRPIPGTDLAGVVEALGPGVDRFAVGDAVFGETLPTISWINGGAFAELAVAPAHKLELKPPDLTFEEAASIPTSGLIALMNLRDGAKVQPGEHVLINGAGGAVGVFAIQLAKDAGATVTGVDHGSKLELMRRLGADAVVDYTEEDFTERPERYDLIVDVASTIPYQRARATLKEEGRYLLIGHAGYGEGRQVFGMLASFFGLLLRAPFDRHLPNPSFDMGRPDDMATLAGLVREGRVRPVVGRVFPMAEVREAMRCLARGDFLGKILLRIPE